VPGVPKAPRHGKSHHPEPEIAELLRIPYLDRANLSHFISPATLIENGEARSLSAQNHDMPRFNGNVYFPAYRQRLHHGTAGDQLLRQVGAPPPGTGLIVFYRERPMPATA